MSGGADDRVGRHAGLQFVVRVGEVHLDAEYELHALLGRLDGLGVNSASEAIKPTVPS